MQMHMVEQLLVPGVQHGREAGLPTQAITRIGCERLQGVGHTAKQEPVDQARVGLAKVIELVRQGEDVVEITDRQQFGLPVR